MGFRVGTEVEFAGLMGMRSLAGRTVERRALKTGAKVAGRSGVEKAFEGAGERVPWRVLREVSWGLRAAWLWEERGQVLPCKWAFEGSLGGWQGCPEAKTGRCAWDRSARCRNESARDAGEWHAGCRFKTGSRTSRLRRQAGPDPSMSWGADRVLRTSGAAVPPRSRGRCFTAHWLELGGRTVQGG